MAGFVVLLLAIAVVGVYWKWILVAVVVVLAWRRGVELVDRMRIAAQQCAAAHAALIADADEQHALVLAGDPRGVHGRWPPADLI
ncbi:MAG: hypothetical protein WBB07_23965 [Mycobacterium sp.]